MNCFSKNKVKALNNGTDLNFQITVEPYGS